MKVLEGGAWKKLKPGDTVPRSKPLLALQPAPAATMARGGRQLRSLPVKLQVLDTKTLAAKDYRPVLQPAREALEFVASSRDYRALVFVGLIDEASDDLGATLPQPVTLQLARRGQTHDTRSKNGCFSLGMRQRQIGGH